MHHLVNVLVLAVCVTAAIGTIVWAFTSHGRTPAIVAPPGAAGPGAGPLAAPPGAPGPVAPPPAAAPGPAGPGAGGGAAAPPTAIWRRLLWLAAAVIAVAVLWKFATREFSTVHGYAATAPQPLRWIAFQPILAALGIVLTIFVVWGLLHIPETVKKLPWGKIVVTVPTVWYIYHVGKVAGLGTPDQILRQGTSYYDVGRYTALRFTALGFSGGALLFLIQTWVSKEAGEKAADVFGRIALVAASAMVWYGVVVLAAEWKAAERSYTHSGAMTQSACSLVPSRRIRITPGETVTLNTNGCATQVVAASGFKLTCHYRDGRAPVHKTILPHAFDPCPDAKEIERILVYNPYENTLYFTVHFGGT